MKDSVEPTHVRNTIVDASKGLAILLVVLGHVLQCHLSRPDDNLVYRVIYSFHMPLFFLLSGWVTNPDTEGRIKKVLWRLLPTAFSWYIIQYFVEQRYENEGFIPYLIRFLQRPDNGLWFLWVLAFCIVALVICRRLERKLGVLAYIIGIAVPMLLPIHYLGISLIGTYFPYLAVGYLCSRSSINVRRASPFVLGISAVGYFSVLPFWHRTFSLIGGKSTSWFDGHIAVKAFEFVGAKYVAGYMGSTVAIFLAFVVCKNLHLSALLWLGRHTLDIYVSHQFFVYVFPSSDFISICGAFFASLFASIAIAVLLKHIPVLDFALFGGTIPRRV